MAIETPPTIDPAPTPGPQRGDESTFDDRMDASIRWFEVSPAQFYASSLNVAHNAGEALTYAGNAQTAANNAATYRDSAMGYRDSAQGYANNANTYAGNAAASAAAAANNVAALSSTSTTSQTISTGSFTFTTQTGKAYVPGANFEAVDQSTPDNAMFGTVTSYSGSTLQVSIARYTGSGTISAWNLLLIGERGPAGATGGVAGGSLTGALNFNKGADVASTATPDIWGGSGNYEVITGTSTITGFSAAPQAGASRRILAGGAFSLTASSNMVIKGVLSGQSYTVAAGDEIDVFAETTTKFRITVIKGDGTAMAALYGAFQNTVLLTGTGTFVAKKTGWHRITLAGGGARGGFAIGGGARATGSSGAGFCVGMRFLIAGQSYNFSQGAGAVDGSLTSAGGTLAGANGGASTFFGSGIATMTANGGIGGLASTGSTATLTGPSGGTATGGDINVQGGKAGDVSGSNSSASVASGGGSVGVQGAAFAAGDAAGNGAFSVATGGAGIGGASGNATASSADASTAGGGSSGASTAATNSTSSSTAGVNYAGVAGGLAQSSLSNFISYLMNATAGGAAAQSTSSAGDRSGGGAGGIASTYTTVDNAGTFAGGPGIAHRGDFNIPAIGGKGGLYGGGNGGVALLANSQTITIRGGNVGLVQVEF